ncbi:helix-turn-helix domain-containing protein [Micromonospora robiginosa]|uniref:Helix-turn-helix transcriptional regulator n=1 Tax=Micromonospora robiginosa TaxID=2749844 RepID=A0A7L6B5V6_9ACTN|nr:helix-turn-helix transcriptional regulator [Micromonospora ferruginea]QLQ37337.1 helix-turn-helix transcriptional regulator [Micromonospora ferruginea]
MTESNPIGERLKALRKRAGLGQREMAKLAHCSTAQISRLEHGSRRLKLDVARILDDELRTGNTLQDLVLNAAEAAARRSGNSRRGEARVQRRRLPSHDAPDVDDLEFGCRTIFTQLRTFGQQLEPQAVLPMAEGLLESIRRAPSRAASGERLTAIAARCADFCGWMAQEQGEDKTALRWTKTAARLAARIQDHDLMAYSHVRHAEISLYRGDPAATISSAKRGQANQRTSPRVRALGARVEAQGHSLMGNSRAAAACLDRMASGLTSTRQPGSYGLLGSSTVDDHYALAVGWCAYDQGRYALAVDNLSRVWEALPSSAVRARGLYGSRLAAAAAANGDLDLAVSVGRRAAVDVHSTRSATGRHQLRLLAASTEVWDGRLRIRELLHEVIDSSVGSEFPIEAYGFQTPDR